MANIKMVESKETKRVKKESEDITVINEAIRVLAIIEYFEKEIGKIPHPLRIFKYRKWLREFEIFQKGFKIGERYAWKMIENKTRIKE